MLGGLWTSVSVEPSSLPEQVHILAACFPQLQPPVIACCMAVLHICQKTGGHAATIHDPGGLAPDWSSAVEGALATAGLRSGDLALHFGHHFSLRDLFKLCRRLQARLYPLSCDHAGDRSLVG